MSTDLTVQENKKVSVFDSDQFNHWMSVAQKLSTSEMIPKNYRGKPMDILIAIDMGKQVGLPMMQALQSIAVINGMPCMYGDAPLAVCMNHPSFEGIKEHAIVKGNDVSGYTCTIKRKGMDEHTVTFTIDNAKKAGLWGKAGPWSQYPDRMLQMRARSFALRNTFPDALKGIQIKEEIEDIVIIDDKTELMKKPQAEKLKSLLAKKGLTHAKTTIDVEATCDTDNANSANQDGGLCSANSSPSPHDVEAENRQPMASVGESKDSFTVTQNVSGQCTPSQLEDIEGLIATKELDKARQLKALDHFNVTSFEELTFEQAKEMIKILNRIE